MRRRWWSGSVALVTCLSIIAVFLRIDSAPAQDNHEARISALETRVTNLEVIVGEPATEEHTPVKTPSPTPFVQAQSGGFELTGIGNLFQELDLLAGTYSITLSCDYADGSANFGFPLVDGDDFTLESASSHSLTLKADTIILLSINCYGAWQLNGTRV